MHLSWKLCKGMPWTAFLLMFLRETESKYRDIFSSLKSINTSFYISKYIFLHQHIHKHTYKHIQEDIKKNCTGQSQSQMTVTVSEDLFLAFGTTRRLFETLSIVQNAKHQTSHLSPDPSIAWFHKY